MDRREPAEPLRDWLVAELAALTGRPAAEIDPTQTFAGNGLDSVKVARLAERVQEKLGRPVDPTVLFEHPTVAALLAHLADPAGSATGTPSRTVDRGRTGRPGGPSADDPVAVVGLACRMPGAPDALAFWQLLLAGTDAVGPVPEGRWPGGAPGAGTEGGFLPDITGFDASFFRITADEADRMDPQQRLLLEVCWEAVEDAGERPVTLRGSRTGVFVGISTNDYAHRQLADPDLINRHTATGNALAVAANRLSYVFDWRGPSLAVDTACSSSLVAVHLAVRALRAGECDRAVAGGVNLLVEPELSLGLGEAGMLAPDGRCKPFAATADGYGRGEGCGALVLKRLSDARAASDRVYAVIRGSAVNQDGGSNGLTAPNPAAQRAVLRDAYADAGLAPHAARYVECHGTGTPLGDPIEARSLAEARADGADRSGAGTQTGAAVDGDAAAGETCLIGSVKSNIGHLESAAGVAGLIKTVLALH
ncbi:type I polyketide synthase, partial [Micromonospora echinofusca]